MGFVQISLDFGFSPAQPETTAAPEEKKSSVNGNGAMHASQPESAKGNTNNGFRRLTPPPPDKILAEEALAKGDAEPAATGIPETRDAVMEEVVPSPMPQEAVMEERVVAETPASEEVSEEPALEEVVSSEEASTENNTVPEIVAEEDVVSEEASETAALIEEEQHISEEETAFVAEENTISAEEPTDVFAEAATTILTEQTEDVPVPAAVGTEKHISEGEENAETPKAAGAGIVFFAEESEPEDDGPIEFELEPDAPEEESGIEKQVSIAYFQKADASDDEEVFEIPMFSKPSTGTDAKPVVIVRVKEKKEAAAENKSKRGRKSIREMMAEAEMVEIPEDEQLFKKQYYGIGEVAKMFNVNTSLIRFWETEFDIIRPKKNRKGDRLFRPIDVKNLHMIHNLLRLKKFTIEGAKDFLKNNRKKAEKNFEIEQSLKRIRGFLLQMKADLG